MSNTNDFNLSSACLASESHERLVKMLDNVVYESGGRWYIPMGKPGFNSKANNRNGYATEKAALAATKKLSTPA